MRKIFIFTILMTSVLASTVFAQWQDEGKLKVWTSGTISRQSDEGTKPTYLKEVKIAKNVGFDRVVFEFTGGLPRYQIKFVKASDLVAPGEELIKISGKYFIDVNLQSLPTPEPEEKIADAKIPKGNLKLPVVSEIKEIEWFEAVREFGIGLNAKKQFRVMQLSNPTRLVIDFKQ
jgi:hypothetical protein